MLEEFFPVQKDAKNNHVWQFLICFFLLDRTCQQQLVFLPALLYCLGALPNLGVGFSDSSSSSSSVILVSKSSISYFIDSFALSLPFCKSISLAKSQYIAAKDFLPLLFAGIIRSILDVMLSVFEIPITGIPAFVASSIACSSVCGSEIKINCGSM